MDLTNSLPKKELSQIMDTPSNHQTPLNPIKPCSGNLCPENPGNAPESTPLEPQLAAPASSGQPNSTKATAPSHEGQHETYTTRCATTRPDGPRSKDEICWRANDGLVSLLIKACPRRWPPSNYPVLVAVLRPKPHTRIQNLDDGSGSIEALFTYEEVEKLVEGVNRVAVETGKGKIFEILQRVPPKDPARKAWWDRFNGTIRRPRRDDGLCR